MAVVCFDFDGVLSEFKVQQFAKKMVKERNEVWVITMRRDNEFSKKVIKPVLQRIGLSEHSVIFCNEKPKFEMIQMVNADIYIDNVDTEFENILNNTNAIPLLFKS